MAVLTGFAQLAKALHFLNVLHPHPLPLSITYGARYARDMERGDLWQWGVEEMIVCEGESGHDPDLRLMPLRRVADAVVNPAWRRCSGRRNAGC